jgi:hypothetical protein
MHFALSTLLGLLTLLLSTTVSALGINCRGSGLCMNAHCGKQGKNCLNTIGTFLERIDPNATYTNGEKIACALSPHLEPLPASAVCAFTQHIEGNNVTTGAEITAAYKRLAMHGCRTCGSAPLDAARNDVELGELTLNYVINNPCGMGDCRQPLWKDSRTPPKGFHWPEWMVSGV